MTSARTMQPTQSVADVVGATVAAQGVKDAFGILGSGNLVVTNALRHRGVNFHHARHECGAICMADGYAPRDRSSRRLQRPSGPGPDKRDDRPDRGREEQDPAARARRRDAERGADLELQNRPA